MENKANEMWQELIESSDFDQLSDTQKTFVLSVSTEENYRLERNILIASNEIYAEVEPRPFILPEKKKAIVIPLYQAILASAAAFVLAFLLFRSNGNTLEIVQNQPFASSDTVIVEKRVVDTVFEQKIKYVEIAVREMNQAVPRSSSPCEKTPSVLSNQDRFDADLSSNTLENKGTSARNDATLVLVESWVNPN